MPPAPGTWVERAACRGIVVTLLDFFGDTREDWRRAKDVCHVCPVRRQCLQYALGARLVHGVWGGLAALELRFALGLDAHGQPWVYPPEREVKCPYCRGKTVTAPLTEETVMRICLVCDLRWERWERTRRRRRARTRTE